MLTAVTSPPHKTIHMPALLSKHFGLCQGSRAAAEHAAACNCSGSSLADIWAPECRTGLQVANPPPTHWWSLTQTCFLIAAKENPRVSTLSDAHGVHCQA